jgi:hypothetical protein
LLQQLASGRLGLWVRFLALSGPITCLLRSVLVGLSKFEIIILLFNTWDASDNRTSMPLQENKNVPPDFYAVKLANITDQVPSLLANHSAVCEIITMLFHIEYGHNSSPEICAPMWDNLSCFPATEAGQQSVIPCPQYIIMTPYDTSRKLNKNTIKNSL